MTRVTRTGMVLLIALLGLTGIARADIRTGSAPDKYPTPEDSSATHPVMDRTSIRYDDQAGSLQVTLNLLDGLADPAVTSALRPWKFGVEFGDYLNGSCFGDGPTWLWIAGSLGDDTAAVLDNFFDFNDTVPDIPVTKTFSADRRQVTLAVTAPRLVGLNLICAEARVFDTRASSLDSSDTLAFLLDGFDAADGAIAREVADHISIEAADLAVRLRPGHRRENVKVSCRELWATEFSCKAAGSLPAARGGVRLTLRGRMSFDARGARKLGAHQSGWLADVRATLSWKRCPPDARPKSLRGKPCHITTRWNGTKPLSDALGV